jgi:hypothetical protein
MTNPQIALNSALGTRSLLATHGGIENDASFRICRTQEHRSRHLELLAKTALTDFDLSLCEIVGHTRQRHDGALAPRPYWCANRLLDLAEARGAEEARTSPRLRDANLGALFAVGTRASNWAF